MEIHKHEPNITNPTCKNQITLRKQTHQTINQVERLASIRTSKTANKKTPTLQLPYAYNIRNSAHLMTELQNIIINKDMSTCSFDIANMCTSIPKTYTTNIINNILRNNHEINSASILRPCTYYIH
jgi:hypothetical protein